MPTTPNYSLRYPANTDSPDIQGHISNLAFDIDSQLLYLNSKQQGIFIIKQDFDAVTPLVTINTSAAETTLLSFDISGAQAGDIYKISLFGRYTNSAGGNRVFNTRVKLGGTTYLAGNTGNIATSATIRGFLMTVIINVESLTVQQILGSTSVGGAGAGLATTSTVLGFGRQFSNQDLSTPKTLEITQAHNTADATVTTALNGYVIERTW
jgi:hypothetical protein